MVRNCHAGGQHAAGILTLSWWPRTGWGTVRKSFFWLADPQAQPSHRGPIH